MQCSDCSNRYGCEDGHQVLQIGAVLISYPTRKVESHRLPEAVLECFPTYDVLALFQKIMQSITAMQLLLALDNHAARLVEIHQRLQRHFGSPRLSRPLDPVSQLILSFLGGRTRGEVSKSAFQSLLSQFGVWESVRDAPIIEIHQAIDRVTFAEVKAPRLKAALEEITRCNGGLTLDNLETMTVGQALDWLESLPGVGRKVAAATLNFSTLQKAALVIDTHHLRVLRRVDLIGPRDNIRRAYDHMMPRLPHDWSFADFHEHHLLMKALGQTICRHENPICCGCPLYDLCPGARPIPDGRRPPGICNVSLS